MSNTSKSGIQTTADGASFIPASKRADGSTRKEIRVRPGYRPPEDVETYKNRSAEAWKNRGTGGVPGADNVEETKDVSETKSKNAKRREAARRKQEADKTAISSSGEDQALSLALDEVELSNQTKPKENWKKPDQLDLAQAPDADADAERQKKIRNQLKKLRAVRELKDKRASGEKLSHDQLMKIGKEDELLRDLKKLDYDGPEMTLGPESTKNDESTAA